MKEYTYGNVTITYNDTVLWLYDSNAVTIESSIDTDQVGAEIVIRHPAGSQTRTIRHLSELSRLVFVLDDALLALADDNIGNYTAQIDVYVNGSLSFTKTYTFQLLYGKSFTNKSHAISRTIYIYSPEELYKLQIYSPSSGQFTIEGNNMPLYIGLNQYNLTSIVDGYGTYTMCLQNANTQPIAIVSGDTARTPSSSTLYYSVVRSSINIADEKGGDVWKYEETVFPVCHTLVYEEPCWNDGFVELRYKDADGCTRYLGGKIASEENKAEGSFYSRMMPDNTFRNIPRKHIEHTSRSLKVGLLGIAKDAYPQDIIYSETVEMRMYNNEWWPITINDSAITLKDTDYVDVELTIIISKD